MNITPTPEEAARSAAQALLDASDAIARETNTDTEAVERGTAIILAAFAPLLAKKDAEIARLKVARHLNHTKSGPEFAPFFTEIDHAEAVKIIAERDAALEVIAKKDAALGNLRARLVYALIMVPAQGTIISGEPVTRVLVYGLSEQIVSDIDAALALTVPTKEKTK